MGNLRVNKKILCQYDGLICNKVSKIYLITPEPIYNTKSLFQIYLSLQELSHHTTPPPDPTRADFSHHTRTPTSNSLPSASLFHRV